MKKSNLLNVFLIFIVTLSFAACGSDTSGNIENNDPSATTRSTSAAVSSTPEVDPATTTMAEEAPESATKLQLARKWMNGDQYIEIKLEGLFEASLDNGVFAGSWDLDDSESTLTLSGEEAAEGKGQAMKNVFKLSKISDETLELTDEQGKNIVFTAE
ncbi:MAG: hypothetical protein MK212_04360 [Saprospiraceae bacterium]|nr:hypothetical protein [Saprospiraceae bacterium]